MMDQGAAPKEDSAVTSANMGMGYPLILSGQLQHVLDSPRLNVPPPHTRHPYADAADSPPAHLTRAEHVYVQVGG